MKLHESACKTIKEIEKLPSSMTRVLNFQILLPLKAPNEDKICAVAISEQ
jgi:hypothetical protein